MEALEGITLEIPINVLSQHNVPATGKQTFVDFGLRRGRSDFYLFLSRTQIKEKVIGPSLLVVEVPFHPVDVHADVKMAHQLLVNFVELGFILSQLAQFLVTGKLFFIGQTAHWEFRNLPQLMKS